MNYKNIRGIIFFAAALLTIITACNNGNDKKADTETKTEIKEIKKDSTAKSGVKAEERITPKKAPIININDTLSIKRMVLCIKDSAANEQRIGLKLGEIYGVRLAAIIKKNGIKVTGPPIAWYKSQKAPYFFEAGLPIDKKPSKLPKGVAIKQIGTDSVVVAHFYGPYDLTSQAYMALQDWIKSHKKKIIQAPYEIYVDDPMDKDGKLKDPYKVQTDIVFTWR